MTSRFSQNSQTPHSMGQGLPVGEHFGNEGCGSNSENPSKRLGSLTEGQIFRKSPLKFLYDDWKRESKHLLSLPFI